MFYYQQHPLQRRVIKICGTLSDNDIDDVPFLKANASEVKL